MFLVFVYIPINDEGKAVSLKFASTDLREWEEVTKGPELPPTPLPFLQTYAIKENANRPTFMGSKSFLQQAISL